MNGPPPGAVSARRDICCSSRRPARLQRAEHDRRRTPGSCSSPTCSPISIELTASNVAVGVGQFAVVLQPHLDTIGEALLGDPLGDEDPLLRRQRDAGGVHAVMLGGVAGSAIPIRSRRRAAACPAAGPACGRSRSSLAVCASCSDWSGVGEVRRRVGHVIVEQQLVEVVGQVVVMGDRGAVAQRGCAAVRTAAPRRPAASAAARSHRAAPRRTRPSPCPAASNATAVAGWIRAACQARRNPSARSPSTSMSPVT